MFSISASSLKSATKKIYIGTAYSTSHGSDEKYQKITAEQFNCITPENEMKWQALEPNRTQLDYSGGDQVIEFARKNNMTVRGHNLLWQDKYGPEWVMELGKADLKAVMKKHITDEVQHYKGMIYAWDVINEPFRDNGTYMDTVFYRNFGPGFIADALKWAHAADPGARLYINDYGVEGLNAKSNALYALVKQLKADGLPIHGVGLQAHFIWGWVPKDIVQNMRRFADLGLDVAITELDVMIRLPATEEKLQQQARDYAQVVKACLAVERCVGITVWGFEDKYSWIPKMVPGMGSAHLYHDYKPKPALAAIEEALKSGGK